MNVVTGLPRSGSTLLCNILNQNPKIYASSTEILAGGVRALTTAFSENPSTISCLINEQLLHEKIRKCVRQLCLDWHKDKNKEIIYNKDRLWASMGLIYNNVFPEGKMIVTCRDLRDIYASLEKQHRQNPLLHGTAYLGSQDVRDRASQMCSEQGLIGACVKGIEDLMRRRLSNVIFIRYEDLVKKPKETMKLIDDSFEYQFDDIVNTAEDIDEVYQNKFPHRGCGKLTDQSVDMWKNIIDDELAQEIYNHFPYYNKILRYK